MLALDATTPAMGALAQDAGSPLSLRLGGVQHQQRLAGFAVGLPGGLHQPARHNFACASFRSATTFCADGRSPIILMYGL